MKTVKSRREQILAMEKIFYGDKFYNLNVKDQERVVEGLLKKGANIIDIFQVVHKVNINHAKYGNTLILANGLDRFRFRSQAVVPVTNTASTDRLAESLGTLSYENFTNIVMAGDIKGKDLVSLCLSNAAVNKYCNRSLPGGKTIFHNLALRDYNVEFPTLHDTFKEDTQSFLNKIREEYINLSSIGYEPWIRTRYIHSVAQFPWHKILAINNIDITKPEGMYFPRNDSYDDTIQGYYSEYYIMLLNNKGKLAIEMIKSSYYTTEFMQTYPSVRFNAYANFDLIRYINNEIKFKKICHSKFTPVILDEYGNVWISTIRDMTEEELNIHRVKNMNQEHHYIHSINNYSNGNYNDDNNNNESRLVYEWQKINNRTKFVDIAADSDIFMLDEHGDIYLFGDNTTYGFNNRFLLETVTYHHIDDNNTILRKIPSEAKFKKINVYVKGLTAIDVNNHLHVEAIITIPEEDQYAFQDKYPNHKDNYHELTLVNEIPNVIDVSAINETHYAALDSNRIIYTIQLSPVWSRADLSSKPVVTPYPSSINLNLIKVRGPLLLSTNGDVHVLEEIKDTQLTTNYQSGFHNPESIAFIPWRFISTEYRIVKPSELKDNVYTYSRWYKDIPDKVADVSLTDFTDGSGPLILRYK